MKLIFLNCLDMTNDCLDMVTDLFPAIQLLATVTLGFVFLGHTDFFTKILREKFFHVPQLINDVKKECCDLIPDKTTLESLRPIKVANGDTQKRIEELKIMCEQAQDDLKKFEEQCNSDLEDRSQLHSLSSMSLFVFLSSIILLLTLPLRNICGDTYNLFFSTFCFIYILLGCFLGESTKGWTIVNFCSHKHSVVYIVILLLLSVAVFLILHGFETLLKEYTSYAVFAYIIIGWGSYLVYSIKLWRKIRKYKADVIKKKEPIIEQCKKIKTEYGVLMTVAKVAGLSA